MCNKGREFDLKKLETGLYNGNIFLNKIICRLPVKKLSKINVRIKNDKCYVKTID